MIKIIIPKSLNNSLRIAIFVILFCVPYVLFAATVQRTIHVATAGTLPNLILESEKYTIEKLTLTGELNGTDFRLLRDMAGCNYRGEETIGKLTVLDFSGSKIVAGGENYVDDTNSLPGWGYGGTATYTVGMNDIMPQHVFHGCKFISVKISNRVTSIGNSAFFGCSGLTSITIPSSVTSIGNDAFGNCSAGLTSIIVESGNKKYDSRNSCNAIIETSSNKLIVGCKNTTIPSSVTSIGNYAFSGCRGLTSITIPSSVTSIGDYAFNGCRGLTSVVSEIVKPFDIGENVFSDYSKPTLTVPSGTKSAYQSTNYWNKFTNIVEASGIDDAWLKEIQEMKSNCEGLLSALPQKIDSEVARLKLRIEEQNIYLQENNKILHGSLLQLSYDLDAAEQRIEEGTMTEEDMQKLREEYERISKAMDEMWQLYDEVSHNIVEAVFQCNEGGVIKLGAYKKIENQQETIRWTTIEKLKFSIEVIPNDGYKIKSIHINGAPASGTTFSSTEINGDFIVQFEKENSNPAKRTIHVETAGTLPDLISESEKYIIEELTLTGELNGTDFRLLRDMGGCNYLGEKTAGKLTVLDFSDTKIVAGGEKYVDTNKLPGWSGSFSLIVDNNDILPKYVFNGCKFISVNISNSVTSIGFAAFYGCSYLNSITIPGSVMRIDSYAFTDCSRLASMTFSNSVTSIGSTAFQGCSGLTSILIPSSVTSIGNFVFAGCSGLISIEVESGNKNYDSRNSCNAIIETSTNTLIAGCNNTTIPSSVTSIGEGAFSGCLGLTSITIPSSVTSIGDVAFSYCYGLTSITIPNSVTRIGEYAFECCRGLTSITIPNSVMRIGNYAFADCRGLSSIVSEIVKPFEINEYVFYKIDYSKATLIVPDGTKSVYQSTAGWNKFTNIVETSGGNTSTKRTIHVATAGTLPNLISESEKYSIEELTLTGKLNGTDFRLLRDMAGNNYLGQNTSGKMKVLDLTNAKVVAGGEKYLDTNTIKGNGVTAGGSFHYDISQSNTFPQSVFCACYLNTIYIPNSVTSIGDDAFFGCSGLTSISIPNSVTSIGNLAFYRCSGLTSLSIPNSVTSIGEGAFYGCRGLTSISIPNSVTSIGYSAFEDCSGLTSIIIPSSVTNIGKYAFYYCSGLTSISIPNSVTSIGEWAFNGCSGLKDVISEIKTPFEISENVFSVYSTAKLTVPSGTKSAYQSTNYWNKFSNIVEASGNIDDWLKEIQEMKNTRENLQAIYDKIMYDHRIVQAVFFSTEYKSLIESISRFYYDVDYYEKMIEDGSMTEEVMQELREKFERIFKDSEEMKELYDDANSNTVQAIFQCNEGGAIKLGYYKTIENQQETIIWSTIEKLKFIIEVLPNDGYRIKSILINGTPVQGDSFSSTEVKGDFIVEFEKNINTNTTRTIHVATAGTLPNLISESEKYTIEELTLTGELNGTDFRLLRDMAGCNYLGEKTSGKLAVLDMTNAKIVAGGEKYLDTDEIYGKGGVNSSGSFHYGINNSDAIPDYVFCGCYLKEMHIPNSVTSIGNQAFSLWSGPTSITIPNSVKSIGDYAFFSCVGLTSITIPNSVMSIGSGAFRYCSGLKDVISEIKTPFEISENVFSVYSTAKLTVPKGTKSAYQSTNYWKKFTNIVEQETETIIQGDANGDQEVNVSDIVEVVNYINNNASAIFLKNNADLNGDGEVNVTDIVWMVNIIMSGQTRAARKMSNRAGDLTDGDCLTIEDMVMNAGETKQVSVLLNNPDKKYTAFQFDLTLPDGITIARNGNGKLMASLVTDRIEDHTLSVAETGDNTYRLLAFSMSNAEFYGTGGALVNIALQADENISNGAKAAMLRSQVFTATNGVQFKWADKEFGIQVNDSENTGIDEILQNSQKGSLVKVYTLTGLLMFSVPQSGFAEKWQDLPSGVYIVNGQKMIKSDDLRYKM